MKDEALEAIWEIRRRIWEECGGDRQRVYERYRREQEEFVRAGGKLISKPGPRLPKPNDSPVIREEPPGS